ncbi:MAG TPA: LamG-like jellyroll fold domain-containing protein [Opitutaceae bacterium]|nr:LamG-like jellyroll fold domain-containing protein [Opitutaceae bacterium]
MLLAGPAIGQDNVVVFKTDDPGVYKGLDLWGFDTAWLSDANLIRGVNFTGKERTDVVRFSFTGDTPLVDTDGDGRNDDLTGTGLAEFNQRMSLVDTYTGDQTALYLNNDTDNGTSNPYLGGGGVDPYKWAELIAVTAQKCQLAGRKVLSVAPFNEPDNGTWQGNVTRFGDVVWQLRWSGAFPAFSYSAPDFISVMGGNTLNNDQAASWYDTLNGWDFVEEGNTHQLAGSFDTYADFYTKVRANGDVATNDELHNVMEAMVGAQYGLNVGIWWGTAQRARGEFVKASDGRRLAYAENRPNWTAASVYRAPSGKVQAFVGESERQAKVTTFRFFSKDRPVFYDGHGPLRAFDVATTGAPGYQTPAHHNAERVVNVTWGEDVQPVIDGRYYLVNRASGQVMEVAGGSTDNGASIVQSAFSGADHQQWEIHPLPNTRGGDYSYFKFAAGHSGKAPDIYGWALTEGAPIKQWEQATNPDWPYPGDNQIWFLDYVADGWFRIGSGWSGLNLATDGATIVQRPASEETSQQWRLIPIGANPADRTPPGRPLAINASANAASVRIEWLPIRHKTNCTYNLLRSTSANGPFETIARGLTTTAYTDQAANQAKRYYYAVVAVDRSYNRSTKSNVVSAIPTGRPSLVAQYAFQLNAKDESVNHNDGVLESGAAYVPGGLEGSALGLNGTGYVSLPAEVANYDQITIATWVYWRGGQNWQRIFDFGNGTGENLFLTPANWSGTSMQFTITKEGVGTHDLLAPSLPVDTWSHVAVVLGNGTAQLFVDGVLKASTTTTIKPSDFNPVLNYIGKSQWPDPMFNGAIDDFRIYNHALSAEAVATLAKATLEPPPGAATIALENADFEAGVGSWPEFDGFDNPAHDVPGWTNYPSTMDSAGVEAGNAWWGTFNGSFSAFFFPGRGAFLQSQYVIKAGDSFDIGYAAKIWWGPSQWTATLFYDNPANVIGSVSSDINGGWSSYSGRIAATPESVGGKLGILFVNTGADVATLDAVTLNPVLPETAPPLLVETDRTILAPANHQMREVKIKARFFDPSIDPVALGLDVDCFIASNEPDNGSKDGHTKGDVNGSDGYTSPVPVALTWDGAAYVATVRLRAERSESGSGRVYTIVCDAVDGPGKRYTTSCEVTVPKGHSGDCGDRD